MRIQSAKDNTTVDLSVNTLGIAIDSAYPHRTYLLHCYKCGKDLIQVQGKLTRVIPWLEPTDRHKVIRKCQCGELYTTQETPMSKSVLVRIPRSSFYCLICRMLLLSARECSRCDTIYDFR